MRWPRASKSSRPPASRTTTSPSSTYEPGRGRSSGKYRFSGRPLRAWRYSSSPSSTNASARKPSHLRSCAHPLPDGSDFADLASWGRTGGDSGKDTPGRWETARLQDDDRGEDEHGPADLAGGEGLAEDEEREHEG